MKHLLLILLSLLILTSCNEDRNNNNSSNGSNQGVEVTIDKDKTIQELKDEKAKLTVELQAITNLIKEKELERVTFWSKLVGGISLALATICLVASFIFISYPLLPTILRYASYILAGVGFLSFTASFIYPYLIPVGFVTLFVILTATGIMWFRDRKSLTQVVKVVEETKNYIPDYKDKFRKVIDSTSNLHIDKVRGKLHK